MNPDHTVAKITAPLAGDGENARSEHALSTLRNSLIPTTLDRVSDSDVSVTGDTAGSHDFNELMKVRTPIVFAFVLGMAFLLLLVTFHSIVIPIKAIILNLLSVGAAYGILVAIFQWGWGESLLGFHSTGSIANWLPLFLFVVLFGLSMDYHVFILSRVKELRDGGMSTEDAVSAGIKGTAGVVTSAAIVMVGVFGLFATLSVLDIKQFGVGAAVAVLLDATVIRAVLLPATMKPPGRLELVHAQVAPVAAAAAALARAGSGRRLTGNPPRGPAPLAGRGRTSYPAHPWHGSSPSAPSPSSSPTSRARPGS